MADTDDLRTDWLRGARVVMGIAQQGLEVYPDVLTSGDVSRLSVSLDSLASRSRAGARHLMRQPAVTALANDTTLLALAAQALGPGARPFRATLFAKSSASNWLVVWHQDTALPLRVRRDLPGWGPWSVKAGVLYAHAPSSALEDIVALRVHLDESGPDNGPLRVLPGTHVHGVLSDAEVQDLVSKVPPHACLCARGSIIAMRPLLVHASSKSTAKVPRRVIHIEYARSFELECGLELDVA